MVRLLITGGRSFNDKDTIRKWIKNVEATIGPIEVIIHGANPRGADKLADELADELGIPKLRFPADWDEHGKAAGPIRNQRMIDEGRPTVIDMIKNGQIQMILNTPSGQTPRWTESEKSSPTR